MFYSAKSAKSTGHSISLLYGECKAHKDCPTEVMVTSGQRMDLTFY